jgi:hypothetical protein
MMRTSRALLLTLALACHADGVAPRDGLLPTEMRLVAEAHAVDAAGLRIDCNVETFVSLTDRVIYAGGRTVQFGTGGGDARRYRDLSPERAVEFWAHTHFPSLEFHLVDGDSIEVRHPDSDTTSERFWRAFALWGGQLIEARGVPAVLATGQWTCYPMDTPPSSGEYYDAEGEAVGTWSLLARNP